MGLPKIEYSRLRFYHFVDKEDQELGTLEDIILDQKTLIPTHIVLGGGFFEEFLEDKGEIEDIDEIASLDLVDHIDNDFIVLSTKLNELETTDKNGEIPIEGVKYTNLIKFQLQDKDGDINGEIVDFELNGEKSSILVYHESIEKELRNLGYYQKFDILIPINTIEVIENSIKIDIDGRYLVDYIKENVEPKQSGRSKILLP